MKNLKKLLIVVAVFTIAIESNAQIFGLKTGLNLSKIVETDGPFWAEDINMKPGFHLGVTAEFPILEKFAIEPGLLFSTKGFKTEYFHLGTLFKDSYCLNYLEIPINTIYKIDLGNAKVLINVGPYFAYAISGKVKLDEPYGSIDNPNGLKEYKIVFGNKYGDLYIKRFDFGLNMGACLEIKSISIGIQYGLGLANLTGPPSNFVDAKQNNRVISISAGYKFDRK